MRKTAATISILLCIALYTNAQTQQDTIYNYITSTAVVIDGIASEECRENADWVAIDQVWIPYGATMNDGDFEGRFKVSWDADYLYLLVEVIDDQLSDDHYQFKW